MDIKDKKIVIIGGGIIGLLIAYFLRKNGAESITILERKYITSGASGRCAGGIRQQWSVEDNIRMMKESVRFFENFACEFGVNIWFRQSGYLFCAKNALEMELLSDNVKLQNSLGVKSKLVSQTLMKHIVPCMDTSEFIGGSFNQRDGLLFPWPVLLGIAKKLRKFGVKILENTEVIDFNIQNGRIVKVITKDEKYNSDIVVNATGSWSREVAMLAGISIPSRPVIHEIMVSEPLKPFLNPMIVLLSNGLYCSQTQRGELISGITLKDEREGYTFDSTYKFLEVISKELVSIFPFASEIKIMRQWSGCYDVTPDSAPILGYVDELQNFIQANGFMGHGFMMAPAIGKIIAEWLTRGRYMTIIEKYKLSRFRTGITKKEKFIIG